MSDEIKERTIEKTNQTNQINQLKIEIFDIIRQQEILNTQFNYLQELKSKKMQELQKIEQL